MSFEGGDTHIDEKSFDRDQPCLEFLLLDLSRRECVGFGQNGDDVDLLVKSFHKLHIQRPQAAGDMKQTCTQKDGETQIPQSEPIQRLS